MGWTTCHATNYKPNGQVDRKAECDALLTWDTDTSKSEVVKSQMVGAVHYAAVKQVDKRDGKEIIFAAVTLTCSGERDDKYFNFGYKELSEDMGPGEVNCPKSILKLLTPTESEWANDWRERCAKAADFKKDLKAVPIGGKIRYRGKILIKRAPAYQFKTDWWEADGGYVPKTHLTYNTVEFIKEDERLKKLYKQSLEDEKVRFEYVKDLLEGTVEQEMLNAKYLDVCIEQDKIMANGKRFIHFRTGYNMSHHFAVVFDTEKIYGIVTHYQGNYSGYDIKYLLTKGIIRESIGVAFGSWTYIEYDMDFNELKKEFKQDYGCCAG